MSGHLSDAAKNEPRRWLDARARPRLIERCGPIARRALSGDGEAHVVAAMTGAFYVALQGHNLICIGSRRLGNGPINVQLAGAPEGTLGVNPGMTGCLASGVLRLGPDFAMAAGSGTTWAPHEKPPFDAPLVGLGLRHLGASVAHRVPADGLATIVLGEPIAPPMSALLRAASDPIEQLDRGLSVALSQGRWPDVALAAAQHLLGLGPGLTPSGDDLLSGVLLALSAAGRADLSQSLWGAVEPRLAELTSPISGAHLRAAAEGLAAEPLHDMLAILLRGDTDDLEAGLCAISAVGHTSGWDALSGLVMSLRALTEPQRSHRGAGLTDHRAGRARWQSHGPEPTSSSPPHPARRTRP